MIHIYTGEGKGKTTAALGLALRASGAGLKVYICQFAKAARCSEHMALKKLKNIKVEQFGTGAFIRKPSKAHKQQAAAGFNSFRRALKSKYDMIILDEVCVAVKLGLIEAGALAGLLRKVPPSKEVVLTGRWAHPALIKCAHLVSRIKKIKHYHDRGLKARKGIEY